MKNLAILLAVVGSVLIGVESTSVADLLDDVDWSVTYMIDVSQTDFGQPQTAVPRNNRGLAISANGRYLYAGYNDQYVRRIDLTISDYIDAADAQLTGVRGKGIAVDDVGRVYLAEGSQIKIYNADLSVNLFNLTGQTKSEGVAVTREGGQLVLYNTDRTDDNLKKWILTENGGGIDAATQDMGFGGTGTVATGSDPRGVDIDAIGRVWVASKDDNTLFRISADGNTVDSVTVTTPQDVDFFGDVALVTQYEQREIVRLDTNTMLSTGTELSVPWGPLKLDPDGQSGYGALSGIAVMPGVGFYVANESGQTADEKSTYGRIDSQSGWIGPDFYTDLYSDDNDPILLAYGSGGSVVSDNLTIPTTEHLTIGTPAAPVSNISPLIRMTGNDVFEIQGNGIADRGSITFYSNISNGRTYGVLFDVANTSPHLINGLFKMTRTNTSGDTYGIGTVGNGTIGHTMTLGEFADVELTVSSDGGASAIYAGAYITFEGDLAGKVSTTAAANASAIRADGFALGILTINGNMTGDISATTLAGANAFALLGVSGVLVDGDISGTITATTTTNNAYGVKSEDDLEITGSLSGDVTATAGGDYAYGLDAAGTLNGGDVGTPLTVADGATVAATADDFAYAFSSGGQMNVMVEKGATVSAESSGAGTEIYALMSSTGNDTVELVAGSTIVGHINLVSNLDTDTLTLSGLAGDSTTLGGDIRNVENINVTGGGTWNLNGSITHGSLTKSGRGTLTLSGTNSYAGGTTVAEGTLFVNGQITGDTTITGGILRGSGQVGNLVNDGTLAPGNSIGTLVVAGDYTQNAGSALEIEINNAGTTPGVHNDLLAVGGTATIDGGTVQVVAAPGVYVAGTQYTFLQSGALAGNGFAGVTDNLAFFDVLLGSNTTDWYFTLNRLPYESVARTPNQMALARYLSVIQPGATGNLRNMMNSLDILNSSNARNAFEQMDGEIYGTLGSVGVQSTTLVYYTLMNRLRPDLSVCQTACQGCRDDCSQWDSWAIGYGLGGNASSDGNAHGFNYSTGGTLIGLDRYLSADDRLGMFFAYGRTYVGLNGLNASANVDNCLLGGYFTREVGRDYFTLAGGFGVDSYTVQRNMQFGEISRTANGDHNGWQSAVYLERGRTFCWNQYALQPYGALQYIHLAQNGFTESNAQSLNLQAGETDTDSFRTLLGLRAMRPLGKPGSQVEFRSLWMHELLDPTVTVFDAGFEGIDAPNFAIDGVDLGRDWAILGTSASWCLRERCRLFASYDIMVNNQQTFHLASGGLEILW